MVDDAILLTITFNNRSSKTSASSQFSYPFSTLSDVFHLDAVSPIITFNNPSTTTGRSPEFTWRSSERAVFECSFDGGRFESCGSGMNGRWRQNNVPDGSHVFSVRGTDDVANVGEPTVHTWIIGKIFFKDFFLTSKRCTSLYVIPPYQSFGNISFLRLFIK